MKVLRHEIFDKGCEAACNGPYDGKWSKTMIGYGSEDDHFVLELTYNYSIGSYKIGNDLHYIKMAVEKNRYEKLKADIGSTGKEDEEIELALNSPDGYKFIITSLKESQTKEDITEVCLSCTDLQKSKDYWIDLLKMTEHGEKEETNAKETLVSYGNNQAGLRLKQLDEKLDHKSAYGRIAFSCPSEELKPIQKAVEDAEHKVLTPYLSLDTPGKATVQVVILADPDGHEICFVGDEGFRELSQVDAQANEFIEKSIEEDKSEEWYQAKKKVKQEV